MGGFMLLAALLLVGTTTYALSTTKTTLKMPGTDSYLCTSVPLDLEHEHYIVGFEPLVERHNAHHILVFGCEEPGSSDPVWDCGEMAKDSGELERAPTCASKPSILYAWAKDAPELRLPEGVGYRVGGTSSARFLVMQVHYMHEQKEADESGVNLLHTEEKLPKSAATMLLVTGGAIAPRSEESFETACVVDEDVTLHPFAFRTHTHSHGSDVSGWVVREDDNGNDYWSLIGRRDPQLPQMFVPVANSSLVISRGDLLTARCHMKNDEDRIIEVGPTGSDEMCNFYIAYWVDNDRTLEDSTCYSPGAPYYYWSSEASLNNIPK